jgi:hypothetical protein
VFAVTAGGSLSVTYEELGSWLSVPLPGTAKSLAGIAYYPVEGGVQIIVYTGPKGRMANFGFLSPVETWSSVALPNNPPSFASRIELYGATAANYASALKGAKKAGLSTSQVTGEFATAWDDAMSGDYLVIAVGLAATDALEFNSCGWLNPSGALKGSTPFGLASAPLKRLPGANYFEQAAGGTAASSGQLAYDLAYYGVHGKLPPGTKTLPRESSPREACGGEPYVS